MIDSASSLLNQLEDQLKFIDLEEDDPVKCGQYRTQSNYLDQKYFLRGKYDIRLTSDIFFSEANERVITSHDLKQQRYWHMRGGGFIWRKNLPLNGIRKNNLYTKALRYQKFIPFYLKK